MAKLKEGQNVKFDFVQEGDDYVATEVKYQRGMQANSLEP